MKAVLIDVEKCKVKTVDIKDDLDTYYNLLNCSCIDIVCRKIGENWYDIICDDEGLFKEEPIVSAFLDNEPHLVGNILVVGKADCRGNLTSLSDEQINEITQNVLYYCAFSHDKMVVRYVLNLSL